MKRGILAPMALVLALALPKSWADEPLAAAEPGTTEPAAAVVPDNRAPEIARALDGLKSPVGDERIAACKSLSFSGITDAAVYDLIEHNVLAQFAKNKKLHDSDAIQEAGWCAKALAYAGSEKYRPTLEKLARTEGRIGDHAEDTLPRIAHFARWNPIINATAGHQAGESWHTTRARNMVLSGDPPLEREGLKAIKEMTEDPTPLHDLVEGKLLAAYAGPYADSEHEDIAAWYCRSLAASRNVKYRDTLRRVVSEAPSKKIRRYAKKALGDLAASP